MLDEPDNYLDVPTKRWLEDQLIASPKTVLFVSHDRELLNRVATRIATLEPGGAGHAAGCTRAASTPTTRPAATGSPAGGATQALGRGARQAQGSGEMYKQKAAYNDGMASRYQAAQTRLAKFHEAGPPENLPLQQNVTMRLRGGRTAKRAVVCERLELSGAEPPALMKPFDLEIWYGERVAVLGSNGSGKSHFLRLLAAGGSDPDIEHRPVGRRPARPCPAHRGRTARLPRAARMVRPDPPAPHPDGTHPAGDPASWRRAP